MKRIEKIRQPSSLKIIFKIVMVLLAAFFWYTLAKFMLEEIAEANDFRYNRADWVRMCDYEYYEKDYGRLKDTLMMGDSQEKEFDVYWEAVNGFEDYQMYLQYRKADAAGVGETEEKMEEYRQKVIANAKKCADSRNKKQLEKYVQLLGKE